MSFDPKGIADGYVMDPDIKDMDEQLKAQGKVGIVYDPSEGIENVADPVANLPNVGSVLDDVGNILEYMCKDEIQELKNNDVSEYTNHMEEKFPAFSFKYYSLFRQIIEGEDITPLFSMLGAIERVKQGQISLDDAEKNLGEELAEQYLYPHVPKSNGNSGGNKKKKKNKNKKKKKGKK